MCFDFIREPVEKTQNVSYLESIYNIRLPLAPEFSEQFSQFSEPVFGEEVQISDCSPVRYSSTSHILS
jgi:hypothetical protein